jgi:hypothetical protein
MTASHALSQLSYGRGKLGRGTCHGRLDLASENASARATFFPASSLRGEAPVEEAAGVEEAGGAGEAPRQQAAFQHRRRELL